MMFQFVAVKGSGRSGNHVPDASAWRPGRLQDRVTLVRRGVRVAVTLSLLLAAPAAASAGTAAGTSQHLLGRGQTQQIEVGDPVFTGGQGPSGSPTPTDTPTPTPTGCRGCSGTLTPTPAPTATPTSCPTGCMRLGYLLVTGPTAVMPLRPVVGDEVTLRYRADYALPDTPCASFGPFGSCQLEGGEGYLEGDAAPTYESSTQEIVVRRRVVSPGVATIRLHVTAMTEDECYYSDPERDCVSYFNPAPIEAFSEPFELRLFDTEADSDGCDISGTRGVSRWLWLIGLALFAAVRRRSSAGL